jgi:hypothetical protein
MDLLTSQGLERRLLADVILHGNQLLDALPRLPRLPGDVSIRSLYLELQRRTFTNAAAMSQNGVHLRFPRSAAATACTSTSGATMKGFRRGTSTVLDGPPVRSCSSAVLALRATMRYGPAQGADNLECGRTKYDIRM